MHDALLDNPIWSALTTTHARFAPGDDAVKRYPRDIGPFIAVARDTELAEQLRQRLGARNATLVAGS